MRAIFLELDTDHDGQLSVVEIIEGMERVAQEIMTDSGQLLLEQQDTDWGSIVKSVDQSDGKVSYEEFIAASYNRHTLLNDESLKVAFDLLDDKKDGTIT